MRSFSILTPHHFSLVAAALGLAAMASGCGAAQDSTGGPTGGATPAGGGSAGQSAGGVATGGASASGQGGNSGGGTSLGASGAAAGGSSTGNAGGTTGGVSGGAGGTTGGVSGGAGGTAGGVSGGAAGRGGGGGAAGGGTAGSSATGGVSGDACPLDLVGFATLEGGTTGGGDASPTVVATQAELRTCATDSAPRVCRVRGTLTFSPFEEIRVTSDKTIVGIGDKAEIVMGGFFLAEGVHNVIIRNLTIRDSFIQGQYDEGGDDGGDRDGIQMDSAHHVWIDHCRFDNLGDGQIDSRKDTSFETVSWNILENHNKAFGIGWTENVTAQLTIHHNWLRNTTQRNPSTDNVLRAHLFNNKMENVSSYGNYARGGTNMVIENSVYENVKDPHYYDTGTLVAIGNVYNRVTGMKEQTGTTYSFFEPSKLYPYRLDAAANVAALLARCAGPRPELGQ